ncbi:MAG TPA: HRDC domain-containing protein [Candidatus Manganitrophaceae bacterium]|nr:HRDC domain-containing protein [Candidatus Manganitrophaceae bacterium]
MNQNYQYITTAIERDQAVSRLSRAGIIGVDTEGDSLYSYQEKVSLIQISGEEMNYIFDPLLLDTLQPLSALLEERSILKIFHGADYDLVSLKRDFGFKIGPIFDTALAARAIGLKEFSLQNLIEKYFQAPLSKTHQKSNWSIRPLPPAQLEYAYQDTAYLVRLYQILKEEVEKRGRSDQIEEECRLLEAITWNGKLFEPHDYLRIKGARALFPQSQQVLRELGVVRDRFAKERNRPAFKVISNDDLLILAKNPPLNEEDLKRLFPRESAPAHRNRSLWLQAVSTGLKKTDPLPKREKSRPEPMTPAQEKLLTKLKMWRNKQAEIEGVEPAMVLTTTVLKEIAVAKPATIEAIQSTPSLRRWQMNRYGAAILKEISNPPA